MAEQKFNTKTQLKKFKKLFILGGSILCLVLLVLSFWSTSKEEAPVKEKRTASDIFSGVKPLSISPADIMSQRLETYQQNQQKINEQNAQKIAQLESENQQYRQAAAEAESNAALVNQKLSTLNNLPKNNSSTPVIMPKPQKLK